MKAEIIFTGTELLLGQILNTNAQYLQQALASIGVDLYYQVTVGDNLRRLMDAVKQARSRADLIIIGGGLGPTEDDLSKEALASTLQLPLEEHPKALKIVRRLFDERGFKMSPNNLKQALVPRGGQPLDNPIGTAPGILLEHAQKLYILLPGPPGEFKRMLEQEVLPLLRKRLGKDLMVIRSKVLKFSGIGEAALDQELKELLHSSNPSLAPTAKLGEVHLRITAKAKDDATAVQMIKNMEEKVRHKLDTYIYGENDQTLAGAVIKQLEKKCLHLALVETITGGYIAHLLSDNEASDKYLELCISTNKEEQLLKLLNSGSTLPEQNNLTAARLVEQLAAGIKSCTGADLGLAITGCRQDRVIYVGTALGESTQVKQLKLWGVTREVKERAATVALTTLWRLLKKLEI